MSTCVAQAFSSGYSCPECKLAWDRSDKDVICGRTLLTKEEIHDRLTELRDRMGRKESALR